MLPGTIPILQLHSVEAILQKQTKVSTFRVQQLLSMNNQVDRYVISLQSTQAKFRVLFQIYAPVLLIVSKDPFYPLKSLILVCYQMHKIDLNHLELIYLNKSYIVLGQDHSSRSSP